MQGNGMRNSGVGHGWNDYFYEVVREDLPTGVTFKGKPEGGEGRKALIYPEKSIPLSENGKCVKTLSQGHV